MLTSKVIGRYGRFANGLFQICSTIGVAAKSGQPFAFPLFINHDHKERFGSSEDIDIYKHFKNPLPVIGDEVQFSPVNVSWGYHDLHLPTSNHNLIGHMQSPKYFDAAIEMVRHFMTFKDEPDYSKYCAIHYRAGDYQSGINVYHPRMTMEYYERAMSFLPADQKYLVFSDDLKEARSMFGTGVDYSEGRDYIADFKLMKKCAHYIIANSSFSLMAAILSEAPDKKVICPSGWFGPAWGSCYKDMAKDLYPKNAIVI